LGLRSRHDRHLAKLVHLLRIAQKRGELGRELGQGGRDHALHAAPMGVLHQLVQEPLARRRHRLVTGAARQVRIPELRSLAEQAPAGHVIGNGVMIVEPQGRRAPLHAAGLEL